MNRIVRSILPALFTLLLTPLAYSQSYTSVAGAQVKDGQGRLLTLGTVCFTPYNVSGSITGITPTGGSPSTGPFCGPVVNGVFSIPSLVPNLGTASPSGLNYQMSVYNSDSSSILTVNWLTSVVGMAWNYDTQLVVPVSLNATASSSGLGNPALACSQGATYSRTNPVAPAAPGWTCNVSNGYTQWFQRGSFPAPSPQQTATIPVVAQMIADAIHGGGGGGGATIPSTTNIISGSGTGNGADSGLPVSTVVSKDGVQTLTNKTLTAPVLTSPVLGTPASGTATNLTGLPLSTGVTGTLAVVNGGTGTTTPGLVPGTNITSITGTWPNQTINASGGGGGSGITGQTTNCGLKAATATTSAASLPVCDDGTTTSISHPVDINDGSGKAGFAGIKQGTTQAVRTNTIGHTAPASVVGYNLIWPGAQGSGPLCNNGAGILAWSGCGGGASLPTATQPGQIISSTAAGTTYAVQPQVFYSQSADTIATIETECSSLCTYVVTLPQTITLAADHALSANVQLSFRAGGKWTLAGGHVLTIPGNVDGTLDQHFAGSAVKFGQSQALVPAEWFGAIGDWNGTTGTDNTASLQAALSSITVGQMLLQAKSYAMTACNLQITASYVGIKGAAQDSVALTADPVSSTLICRSASADILHIAGSSNISSNQFDHFTVSRSVAPSAGSNGIYLTSASLARFNWVSSNGSNYGFHIVGCSGCGADYFFYTGAYWYDVTIPGGMEAVGYYLDSTAGQPSNSLVFDGAGANGTVGSAGTYITMKVKGQAINDLFVDGLQSTQADYGVWLEYTGGGIAGTCSDLHFGGSIIDQPRLAGYHISGLSTACLGSVEINGGWIASSVGGNIGVDIENSNGVTVEGTQIFAQTVGVRLGGTSTLNSISGNTFLNGTTGISVSAASTPNTIYPNQYASTVTTQVADSGGGYQTSPFFQTTANIVDAYVCSNTGNCVIGYNNTSTAGNWNFGIWGSTGTTPGSFFFSDVSTGTVPLKLSGTGATVTSLIDTALTSGTSPICPNGTGGALTTVGCSGGGGFPITGTGLSLNNPSSGLLEADGGSTSNVVTVKSSATPSTGISILNTSGPYEYQFFVGGSTNGFPGSFGIFNYAGSAPLVIKANDDVVLDGSLTTASGKVIGWNGDTGFSRDAGNVIDCGNGTAGNRGCTLQVANLSASAAVSAATVSGTQVIAGSLATGNCTSSASPAVCGALNSGSVVIAAGATTVTVNTTAVTANSQIFVMSDSSLGTKLGVTCNTTGATTLAGLGVTARTAGTSFEITTAGTVSTNPLCLSYTVIN